MKKKLSNFHPLVFLFLTIFPLHTLSSVRYRMVSATPQQGQQRKKPANKPQQRPIAVKKAVEPSPIEVQQEQEPTVEEEEEQIEEPSRQPETIEEEKNAAATTAPVQQPGMLTAFYATIAPIILVTLNKASESGIAAFMKTMIKRIDKRHDFLQMKEQAYTMARNKVPTQDEDAIARAANDILIMNNIDPDSLEKATAFTTIVREGTRSGITYTAVTALGAFMGMGIAIFLNTLMPAR